jgi:hypothetical protein
MSKRVVDLELLALRLLAYRPDETRPLLARCVFTDGNRLLFDWVTGGAPTGLHDPPPPADVDPLVVAAGLWREYMSARKEAAEFWARLAVPFEARLQENRAWYGVQAAALEFPELWAETIARLVAWADTDAGDRR